MSVRVNQRPTPPFETGDKALELSTYTLNILSNEKIFIPKHQRTIDRISEEVTMIYHNIRVANSIKVKNKEQAMIRLQLQRDAMVLVERLITDIMIAHKLFHLKASRVKYWTKLTVETNELLKAWNKSDKNRFKEYGL